MKNFLNTIKLSFVNVFPRIQSSFLSTGFTPVANFTSNSMSSMSKGPNAFYSKLPRKKVLFIFLSLGIVILLFVVVARAKQNRQLTDSKVNGVQNQSVGKDGKQIINREFAFPIRNENNKEISTIRYEIESAELRNEIYIKGEQAKAIKGRTFLIINLKITNQEKKGLQIRTRDYIRLSSNMSTEWLAPDIHNDPVEVQAISTKYTRVGFIINESDKNLTLQIGEIDGNKQTISLYVK